MYSVLLLSFNLKCVCGYAAAFGNSSVLRWESFSFFAPCEVYLGPQQLGFLCSRNISNLVASFVAEVSHFHSLSKLSFRYSAFGGGN